MTKKINYSEHVLLPATVLIIVYHGKYIMKYFEKRMIQENCPYFLCQEPADVDLKKQTDKCQTVKSSSENYETAKLEPFELIQEMESYVMILTRLKGIEIDIETMPRFFFFDTKMLHHVYKSLIRTKSGLIELMANKIVAVDEGTSVTDTSNGMEETGK